MRDSRTNIKPVLGIASQTLTASSTSAAIDLRGYDSALIVATIGTATITPSTTNKFAVVVKECSSSAGTFTPVAKENLIGGVQTGFGSTIGAIVAIDTTAKPSNVYAASYVGGKRWIRTGLAESGTAAIRAGVAVIGGELNSAPKS